MPRGFESPLVDRIGEWLIDRALAEHPLTETFAQLCTRLRAMGVPVTRGRVTWPTLHPLFRAETMFWRDGRDLEFKQFPHQDDDSEEWKRSPLRWMTDNGIVVLRRRLAGADARIDFPLLQELQDEGYSDFLVMQTAMAGEVGSVPTDRSRSRIYVTWATNQAAGFNDDDLDALLRLQRYFAVACKTALQPRITRNIANTYLGETVGRQVLAGRIKLGSGARTRALVWYSDLRDSTRFSETLPEADYLDLLNDYFACVARAALDAGGEILAFIGDAVLAIFPVPGERECERGMPGEVLLDQTAAAATGAARGALLAAQGVNATRGGDARPLIRFGIAMSIGDVMFGNIGIDRRLSFSVIGPTVNEVARLEAMTKTLRTPVLATRGIAAADPDAWTSLGEHPLRGIAKPVEIFGLASEVLAGDRVAAE